MPIPSRREAGIAKQVSVDSEDEDDWGHFSFEDGDAPPSSLENYPVSYTHLTLPTILLV